MRFLSTILVIIGAALLAAPQCASIRDQDLGQSIGTQNLGTGTGTRYTADQVQGALPSEAYAKFLFDACDMNGNGSQDACTNSGWSDGDAVDASTKEWNDKGAINKNLEQATVSSQPEYDVAVAALGGGSRSVGVYFDGSDLLAPDTAASTDVDFLLDDSAGHTCVIVFAASTTSNSADYALFNAGSSSTEDRFVIRTEGGTASAGDETIAFGYYSGSSPGPAYTHYQYAPGTSTGEDYGNPQMVWWYSWGDQVGVDDVYTFVNSMALEVDSADYANLPLPGNVDNTMDVGNTSGRELDGWIHFLACYSTVLTAQDRTDAKTYFEWRLGVTF